MLIAVLVMLLMLFVPGSLAFVAAGIPTCASLALSPIVVTAWLGVAGVVYALVGIPANPLTVLVPLTVACLLAAILFTRRNNKRAELGKGLTLRVALLYIAVGAAVCLFVFVSRDTATGSFIQQWDNDTYLSIIRAFADSQTMSSLRVSPYLTAADAVANPFGGPDDIFSFYPAVFHGLCALVVLWAGVSAPMAINASIIVTGSIVFPLAMALCISEVFRDDKAALLSGAVLCCLFPAMPYALVVFGPLYPNLFAFALLPLGVALVFGLMHGERGRRAFYAGALLVTVVALALVHPNADFSLGVLTVPSIAVHVFRTQCHHDASFARAWAMAAGVLVAAIAAWVALYNAPFLQGVISNYWGTYESLPEAIRNQAFLITSSHLYGPKEGQPLLFALAAIGVITDIIRHHRPGLVASYIMLQVMSIVASSVEGPVRQFMTGFWYTDSNRIAAFLVIPAIIFAAEGVSGIYCFAKTQMRKSPKWPPVNKTDAVPAFIVIVLVSVEAFVPVHYYGALNYARDEIDGAYGHWNPLNNETIRNDLKDIKEIVGNDTVANSTYDGSLYLYGTNDIRVLYRTNDGMVNAQGPLDTDGAQIVRTCLDQIASNGSVRAEVERRGIRWVLQMDVTGRTQQSNAYYHSEDWAGIESIDENTPGFQLVYKDNNIRLYRVVG